MPPWVGEQELRRTKSREWCELAEQQARLGKGTTQVPVLTEGDHDIGVYHSPQRVQHDEQRLVCRLRASRMLEEITCVRVALKVERLQELGLLTRKEHVAPDATEFKEQIADSSATADTELDALALRSLHLEHVGEPLDPWSQ